MWQEQAKEINFFCSNWIWLHPTLYLLANKGKASNCSAERRKIKKERKKEMRLPLSIVLADWETRDGASYNDSKNYCLLYFSCSTLTAIVSVFAASHLSNIDFHYLFTTVQSVQMRLNYKMRWVFAKCPNFFIVVSKSVKAAWGDTGGGCSISNQAKTRVE
jgi:hypothetical protein